MFEEFVLFLLTWVVELGDWVRLLRIRLLLAFDYLLALIWRLLEWVFPRKKITLHRLPKHLGVLFTEPPISLDLVSTIAAYCLLYKIPRLTLYDPEGGLKAQKLELREEIAKKLDELDVKSTGFSINGGTKGEDRLELWVLDESDGRGSLSRVARELCERVERGTLDWRQIDERLIAEGLATRGVREVDFLLKFGRVDSLLGFPPWSLRVTEILSLPSCLQLSELQFVECLDSFSRRNQRFGK